MGRRGAAVVARPPQTVGPHPGHKAQIVQVGRAAGPQHLRVQLLVNDGPGKRPAVVTADGLAALVRQVCRERRAGHDCRRSRG